MVLHRALVGSLERFFGIFLEHFGGALPVWLTAVQARVLPVAERHGAEAGAVTEDSKRSVRVELDERQEPLGGRVRDAAVEKVPYVLVIGDRELAVRAVFVRFRGSDEGPSKLSDWLERLEGQVEARDDRPAP